MLRPLPLRVRQEHTASLTLLTSPGHSKVTPHFALCLAGREELSLPLVWGPRPTLWLQKFIAKDITETLNMC